MKMKHQIETRHRNRAALAQAGLLAVMMAAGVVGTAVPAVSQAQSTSASIVGQAPAGDRVVLESTGGMHRETTVKDNGRYAFRRLPLHVYMVTLFTDGEAVDKKFGIRLQPGGHARVDFPCKNDDCTKQANPGKD